jgi:hypothetical protein
MVAPHFYNSTQHVVTVTLIKGVAYKCSSVSGTKTVWRDTYFSKHAATNIGTACCTFITYCYKSAQHVVKVATIISMACKCNSVSGFFNRMARYLINKSCCNEYCDSMLHFYNTLLQICTACCKSGHNDKYGEKMQQCVRFIEQHGEIPDQLSMLPRVLWQYVTNM